MTTKQGLVVGFTYNLRRPNEKYDLEFLYKYSEWDSPVTIEAIKQALEETGNEVVQIPVDEHIYERLRDLRDKVDIVFNIAEGLSNELIESNVREALVPTFLEHLMIPYTGSGPMSLAECLDKARAKEIAGFYGVKSASFQIVREFPFKLSKDLSFPIIVKLNSEGSSIGLTQQSKVDNLDELNEAVRTTLREYKQPVLLEEFIGGTEYTVGIVGRFVLPVMKIDLLKLPGSPCLRDQRIKDIEPKYTFTNTSSEEPALSLAKFDRLYLDLARTAIIAHEALRCRDFDRLDLRERNGEPHLLELNPLPGMHPTDGDIVNMAKAAGMDYCSLVNFILYEGIKRYRSDERFSKRFTEDRIKGIVERVQSATSRMSFLSRITVANSEYSLLGPSRSIMRTHVVFQSVS